MAYRRPLCLPFVGVRRSARFDCSFFRPATPLCAPCASVCLQELGPWRDVQSGGMTTPRPRNTQHNDQKFLQPNRVPDRRNTRARARTASVRGPKARHARRPTAGTYVKWTLNALDSSRRASAPGGNPEAAQIGTANETEGEDAASLASNWVKSGTISM